MAVDVSFVIGTYGSFIAFFAMLVIFAGILIFLAGRMLRIPEWEAYLNAEMSELVASCVIAIFVVGFFIGADSLAHQFLPRSAQDAGFTPPEAAAYRMSVMRNVEVSQGVSDIFALQVCLSILSTFQRRLGEAVLTNTYKVFPAVDSMVQVTSILGYGMVAVANSLDAQTIIFLLIDSIALPFLLPAGILFRFIPPTRQAGNFLIALSIAFQSVFPIIYLLNFAVIDAMNLPKYSTPIWLFSLCGGKYAFFGLLGNPNAAFLGLVPGFGAFANVMRVAFAEYTINLLSPLEFTAFMQMFARLSLPALFMPALATTIAIAFINSFKKFLELKVE